jgi:hypothetical protein
MHDSGFAVLRLSPTAHYATVAGLMLMITGPVANGQATVAARPVPRLADKTVNLGAPRGSEGHWDTGVGNLSEQPVAMEGSFLADLDDLDKVAPFKPWSKALVAYRNTTLGKDDPHPRCMANGGPRQFHTPYGIDVVQDGERERILILSGGGPRSYRTIHMDGRGHPDLEYHVPTFFGHSIGHWDGDTLVIDTVGFNERFWFTRRPTGMVHTDALHLIERISRPNFETLHYEVTIDDPKAYTRPWTASWDIPWTDEPMIEYFCTDNNLDLEHIVGPGAE